VHTTPAGLALSAPTGPVLAAARRGATLGFLRRVPAAWCDACGRRWYSQQMADALADGQCPVDGKPVRLSRQADERVARSA
jgi:hypothetical protein